MCTARACNHPTTTESPPPPIASRKYIGVPPYCLLPLASVQYVAMGATEVTDFEQKRVTGIMFYIVFAVGARAPAIYRLPVPLQVGVDGCT